MSSVVRNMSITRINILRESTEVDCARNGNLSEYQGLFAKNETAHFLLHLSVRDAFSYPSPLPSGRSRWCNEHLRGQFPHRPSLLNGS